MGFTINIDGEGGEILSLSCIFLGNDCIPSVKTVKTQMRNLHFSADGVQKCVEMVQNEERN